MKDWLEDRLSLLSDVHGRHGGDRQLQAVFMGTSDAPPCLVARYVVGCLADVAEFMGEKMMSKSGVALQVHFVNQLNNR